MQRFLIARRSPQIPGGWVTPVGVTVLDTIAPFFAVAREDFVRECTVQMGALTTIRERRRPDGAGSQDHGGHRFTGEPVGLPLGSAGILGRQAVGDLRDTACSKRFPRPRQLPDLQKRGLHVAATGRDRVIERISTSGQDSSRIRERSPFPDPHPPHA